jgi:hypothetical protein
MTFSQKICLSLFAVAALSACKPKPVPAKPINPNTAATFEIQTVLHNRNDEPVTRLPMDMF